MQVKHMKDVKFYLNQVATKTETGSDYATAKLLNVKPSRISNYRTGRSLFDNAMCIKIAEILEVDPLPIIATMEAIRAKDQKQKSFWEGIASTAASVILALAMTAGIGSNSAAQANSGKLGVAGYILCKIARLRRYLAGFLLVLASSQAFAGEWVGEIGLGIHSNKLDAPEINLENPLFMASYGYDFDDCGLFPCTVKAQHISGLLKTEQGLGLTVIMVTYKF